MIKGNSNNSNNSNNRSRPEDTDSRNNNHSRIVDSDNGRRVVRTGCARVSCKSTETLHG